MNFVRFSLHQFNPEFYTDEMPLLFLGPIHDLNVIVGANNSRKSRFLRQLIAQEHPLMLNYEGDLNALYHEGTGLLAKPEGGPKELWDDKLLMIKIEHLEDKKELENQVKAFFHRKSGQNDLDVPTLRTHLDDLLKALINIAVPDNYKNFFETLDILHGVVTMAILVYEHIAQFEGRHKINTNKLTTFLRHIDFKFPGNNPGDMIPQWNQRLELLRKLNAYLEKLKKISPGPDFKHLVYLPVLRSARKLEGSGGDTIYENTLRKQYNIKEDSRLTIETGLDLYEKIGLARNGTRAEMRDFLAFEQFISDTFFQGETVHIVARRARSADNQHVHVTLPGEREDVTIQELGDGIQGLIALLFPVFTAKPGCWILIDEPENHLHPGFQLILIQALAYNPAIKAKNLTFFINTHSNHILSEALLSQAGLEVFVFNRRDEHSTSVRRVNGHEHTTLEMMGVLNTSVLISNSTVWVEGITDRLYLRAFLYAYQQTLENDAFKAREGLHYSFVEYGGKNLSHYDFEGKLESDNEELLQEINSVFLNANVFLLADHDGDDEKHKAFLKVKRPNFVYHHTVLPEIENLIPTSVWKGYLVHEKKFDVTLLKSIDIQNATVKLGEYLEPFVQKRNKSIAIKKKNAGGTLSYPYKKGIADYVYRQIINGDITWQQLAVSPHLKEIVEALYKFISNRNLAS